MYIHIFFGGGGGGGDIYMYIFGGGEIYHYTRMEQLDSSLMHCYLIDSMNYSQHNSLMVNTKQPGVNLILHQIVGRNKL